MLERELGRGPLDRGVMWVSYREVRQLKTNSKEALMGSHNGPARWGRAVAPLLLATHSIACASWRVEGAAPEALVTAKHPDQIRVLRANNSRVVLQHPTVAADSLRGSDPRAHGEVALPLSDVRTLETRHTDAGKSLLLGVGIAGAVVAVAAIAAANTQYGGVRF